VTLAVPPLPLVSSCHVQLSVPLEPTVRADPSKDAGRRPVEYTTDAVHDWYVDGLSAQREIEAKIGAPIESLARSTAAT
jgi:hypothetical protein